MPYPSSRNIGVPDRGGMEIGPPAQKKTCKPGVLEMCPAASRIRSSRPFAVSAQGPRGRVLMERASGCTLLLNSRRPCSTCNCNIAVGLLLAREVLWVGQGFPSGIDIKIIRYLSPPTIARTRLRRRLSLAAASRGPGLGARHIPISVCLG